LLTPYRSTAGYARRSRLASAQNPLPRMHSYFGDTTPALAVLALLAITWVHAADWQDGNGYRSAPLSVPPAGKAGFVPMPPAATGILFTNRLSVERYTTNQIYLNGSGVAAGDVDGDGLVDLYFCGLDGPNALYRNLGNWKFEDITDQAGVACPSLDATGAALVDVDGDGDLDLIVNSVGGGTHVFLNDGRGQFREVLPGYNPNKGGMSMALADVDGDGYLDLYVANYRADTMRDHPQTHLHGDTVNGRPVVLSVNGRPVTEPDLVGRYELSDTGKIVEHGEADVLFRNVGQGKFVPVSFTNGTFLDEDGIALKAPPYDWGLSVMFRDMNGDGAPDIYVCNDFASEDRIWINDGRGKFRALPRLALRHTSLFSMGIDFADVNRDGFDDFFVADMLSRLHPKRHVQVGDLPLFLPHIGQIDDRPQFSHNTLFLNRGDSTYAEIAYRSGVQASEWSWTPVFLDVDLDGYEDLLITTGHELEMMNADVANRAEEIKAQKKLSIPEQLNLRHLFSRLDSPNVAFRNRGDLTFEDVSDQWGFDAKGVSHGMCLCDLDGDGDLDVVMNNLNGAAGVYRNESNAGRVAVRLRGLAPNTRGIGAKIRLYGGAVAMQSQEMICGGRYLSSDDAMRVFGAGSQSTAMRLEVSWRSGKRSVVEGVRANRIYEVEEEGAEESSKLQAPSSKPISQPSTLNSQPIFEEVSELIGHRHHEEEYNDYERQGLLPRKLSQLGPGVGWYDVDGDGWEDLMVSSGRGGQLAVYRNDGKGGFEQWKGAPFEKVVMRDQTSVLGTENGLVVGSANYEDGLTNGGCVRIYDGKRKVSGESVLGQGFSVGPLALGDVDGDGDLDLFVGGRVIGGRYPEPADSLILKNEEGRLVVGQRLEKLGMVSGAVFSDVDGDGQVDLVVACEWGPIRIYRNEQGKLVGWDAPVTLNNQPSSLKQLSGWWNGVTSGDLDGDGRMDLVASNWGLNSQYRTSREHPRKLYYGDMEGRGTVELVEGYYEEGMKEEVPERGLRAVGAVLPFVKEKYGTYEGYGKGSLKEIYGEKLKRLAVVEVNTLESMVFMNRGDHFEARALPVEAQLAPGYGVCVGDYDGDGKEDVFMSQNFFGMNAESSRCDGGRGLWMRGDGKGNLEAVSGQQSGVKVYGEQRGAALCDYDGDGRVDLVVTQNGAETKLYHNVGGKVGLRVRLKGSEGNAHGVGAQMRPVYGAGGGMGPAREIHAGSGYWSEDSAVEVLGGAQAATQLWVRWPGGKITTSPVPKEAKEISVHEDGSAEKFR
jgi:enediyne biosynthesis protein E4